MTQNLLCSKREGPKTCNARKNYRRLIELQEKFDECNKNNIIIVMGDGINVKLGQGWGSTGATRG
jgi:hypothetical protein